MSVLYFDAAELRPIIEHTRAHTQHTPTYDQLFDPRYRKAGFEDRDADVPRMEWVDPTTVPPALHLVKDEGIYLVSSAVEPARDTDGRPRVCYARGANPSVDPDWYAYSVAAVGGDDFVEALPIEAFAEVLRDPAITDVIVDVTRRHLLVRWSRS